MYNDVTYQHDNLCFNFDFVEENHQVALGLKVAGLHGEPIMQQAYPFNHGTAGASWLLYWHLLRAAGQKVIHRENEQNFSFDI